jgi:hypothetical protein
MLKSYGYGIAFGFLVGALAASVFWTALLSPLTPPYSTENQQGTKSANKEAAKVSADDRIADYTEWLAVLTGGLVVVSAIQIGFLIRADKTARISADAAKKSANAATLSAQAAIGVELPKLFVTNIDFELATLNVTDLDSSFHKLSITITNYGRTPAFLQRESAEFLHGPLPTVPIYSNAIDLEPGTIIEKGQLRTLVAYGRDNRALFDMRPFIAGQAMLWVYGAVWFRDFLNEPHVMRFCAELHVPKGRATGHPPKFIQWGPTAYTESY